MVHTGEHTAPMRSVFRFLEVASPSRHQMVALKSTRMDRIGALIKCPQARAISYKTIRRPIETRTASLCLDSAASE